MERSLRVVSLAAMLCVSAVSMVWAKSHSGMVTVEVDLSAHAADQDTRLWIPYPVSDRDQTVTDIRFSGDYSQAGVYTDKTYGTPILYAEWPKEAQNRKLALSFEVERQEVRHRDFPAKQAAWNPADYAEFLKPTYLGPTDGEVKKLSDSITKGKKTVMEKAKAIYDWTCENMYRDPDTIGCGKGDVCMLLKKPGGKCTDISSVYIALARAAGVPAREIFSVRLPGISSLRPRRCSTSAARTARPSP